MNLGQEVQRTQKIRSRSLISLCFTVLCRVFFEWCHCSTFPCWPWLCDVSNKLEKHHSTNTQGRETTDEGQGPTTILCASLPVHAGVCVSE